jgi:AraC-like DNA-binding protein
MLLPGTGAELIIHFRRPFAILDGDSVTRPEPAHTSCLRTHACRILAEGPIGFVAARFRTCAIRHLSDLAFGDMTDLFLPAHMSLGPDIGRLPEEMAALPDFRARARRLEEFLLARVRGLGARLDRADAAIDQLYYSAPETSIDDIAAKLGQSRRQLEREVKNAAGITPKRYQGLSRFHHTVRELLISRRSDYLDTALARGYYDQSHVIHDFKELTGLSLARLLAPENAVSHFYNSRIGR